MDLSKVLDQSEVGAVMTVINPATNTELRDADGEAVTITLAGIDSARWRKAQDTIGDRRLKQSGPRTSSSYKSMAEAREDQAAMYAHVTVAWRGVELDGISLDCTFDNAKKLYGHPGLGWLCEQVDRFIGDRQNFSTASSQG